jgi:hypothetical protein
LHYYSFYCLKRVANPTYGCEERISIFTHSSSKVCPLKWSLYDWEVGTTCLVWEVLLYSSWF